MKRILVFAICLFAVALTATAQDDAKGYRMGVRFEGGVYQVLVPGGTWASGTVNYTISIPSSMSFTTLEWFNFDAADNVQVVGTADPTPWPPTSCLLPPNTAGCQQFLYAQYPGVYTFTVGGSTTVNITVDASESVPALSTYGLIGLFLLLGASAVFIIRKRRLTA